METKESNWSYFLESIANTITSLSSNRKVGNGYDINVLERRQEAQNGAEHGKFVFLHGNTIAVEKAIRKVREPLNNSLCSVPTRCISRNLHLVKVISVQNSHYLSAFLLLFLKKGRLPPCIRLRRVFARLWQAHTNWHKRTWRTVGSRFSSDHDTRFSCSRTDT